jgi:hypothetical protein
MYRFLPISSVTFRDSLSHTVCYVGLFSLPHFTDILFLFTFLVLYSFLLFIFFLISYNIWHFLRKVYSDVVGLLLCVAA